MPQKELKVIDLIDNKELKCKRTIVKNLKETTKRYILGKIPDKTWVDLLRDAVNDALNGDKATRQYLLDQGLGKPLQAIENTTTVTMKYDDTILQAKQRATELSNIHIHQEGISEDIT